MVSYQWEAGSPVWILAGVLTAACTQNCLLWQREQEEGNGVVWDYGWIPESSDVLLETKKHRSEMWSLCTRLLTKAP